MTIVTTGRTTSFGPLGGSAESPTARRDSPAEGRDGPHLGTRSRRTRGHDRSGTRTPSRARRDSGGGGPNRVVGARERFRGATFQGVTTHVVSEAPAQKKKGPTEPGAGSR